MRLRPELIIGVALVVIAFVALFLVANVLNPPAQLVLAARHPAGRAASPELARAVEVQLPSSIPSSWAEADQFEELSSSRPSIRTSDPQGEPGRCGQPGRHFPIFARPG
jgi:hypothetical protein